MAQGQASDDPAYPTGFPAAYGAGAVVNLRLFIPGKPVPQGRPKARIQGYNTPNPRPQIYEPAESRNYKEYVAEFARTQALGIQVIGDDFVMPFTGVQCFLNLRFNMVKPPSYPKRVTVHTKRPDFDNLTKSVVDGLVNARILEDDGCITDSTIQKRYAEPGHPEGVEVDLTVRPVETV